MGLEIRAFTSEDCVHIKHKRESKYLGYARQILESLLDSDKVVVEVPEGFDASVFQVGIRSRLKKLGAAILVGGGTDDRTKKSVIVVTTIGK